MKRFFCILLCLAMCLSLGACAAKIEVNVDDTAELSESAAAADRMLTAGETWTVEENTRVGRLEIPEGASVEAEHPVIVFFEESDTVENGEVRGEVQFVSDYDEAVAIVHTNDTHGFLEIEPYVKGLKTQLEESGDYSLVLAVSAGDVYAGGYAAAHVYDGEYIPAVMSRVYDYMTWGNNDAGITDGLVRTYLLSLLAENEGLTSLVGNAIAKLDTDIAAYAATVEATIGNEAFVALYPDSLALNADGSIDWSALGLETRALVTDEVILPAWATVETANGTVIGLFGETTQAGPLGEDIPEINAELDTIPVAEQDVAELKAAGATVIVGVCHTGWFGPDSTEASSNDTNSAQIALQVAGIDAIVDGHTHSIIENGEGWLFADTGAHTIVNQADCKGNAIGVMTLYLKDGVCIAKDCDNYTAEEYKDFVEPDADTQAVVDLCYDRLAADGYTTTLAVSEHFLNGERLSSGDVGGGVRANETNLGDLVADGMLWAGAQVSEREVSIALYPGVRVRSSIPAGEITMIDILSVFSSPVVIYYKSFTAAELVQELNSVLNKIGQENTPFTQVAGLSLVYNSDKKVETLTVGDELIYDGGAYFVGEDWTVGCVCCDAGGDATYEDEDILFADSTETAWAFRDFLANGEYDILPNTVAPGGRIVPTDDYVENTTASGEASGEGSGEPSGEGVKA